MKYGYFIAVFAALALPVLIWGVDDDIAAVLLKKGDEALQKNDIAKAIEFYRKALKERPNFPDAYFKLGNAAAKAGDKRKARRHLEECLRLIKDNPKPPASLQTLAKDATARLNSLDKNKQEVTGLDKKYIEQLLALSKRTAKKDIPLTESILKTVLYIDRSNADAAKLMQELKQARVFEPWQELFNGQDIIDWQPQEAALWKVKDNILSCDSRGALINHQTKVKLEKEYKLLLEFKADETYHELASVGVILGSKMKEGDLTALSVFKDAIKLISFQEGKGADLKEVQLPQDFKLTEWNTLMLDISYTNLKCYLNDKLVLEYRSEGADFFAGYTGIWLQRVKAQIRQMKYLKE